MLVGHWLRFNMRNQRFRTMFLLSLPMAAFLAFSMGRSRAGVDWFSGALGAAPVLAFIGTARIAVNQFGYTAGGFRRFLLLPTDPAACLRAASYASVLLGAMMIPLGLIAWIVLAPGGARSAPGHNAGGQRPSPDCFYLMAWASGRRFSGRVKGITPAAWATIFRRSAISSLFTCMLGGMFLPVFAEALGASADRAAELASGCGASGRDRVCVL